MGSSCRDEDMGEVCPTCLQSKKLPKPLFQFLEVFLLFFCKLSPIFGVFNSVSLTSVGHPGLVNDIGDLLLIMVPSASNFWVSDGLSTNTRSFGLKVLVLAI